MEHEQMRGLLSQMAAAARGDVDALIEHGDTLLMLTQQHNVKEEGILYPMAGGQLRAQWPELARALGRYLAV
jgi:hemerythrin-like domain-containing protein